MRSLPSRFVAVFFLISSSIFSTLLKSCGFADGGGSDGCGCVLVFKTRFKWASWTRNNLRLPRIRNSKQTRIVQMAESLPSFRVDHARTRNRLAFSCTKKGAIQHNNVTATDRGNNHR